MFATDSRWRWATRSLPFACVMVGPVVAQQAIPSGVEATTVTASAPDGVAYDSSGNLYIALRNDHVVRKVDVFGIITTVAGTGQQGFSGDGGAATSALLDSPSGIAVDANGNLYIADSRNHRIRRVTAGVITTVAGTGTAGFAGDGGNPAAAQLNLPTGISLDATGNLYIADTNNQRVRRIAAGAIATVAGTGEQGFAGDGQQAVSALLDTPYSVAADPTSPGSFFIADTHNQRLRRVNASGVISTVAGNGAASQQAAINLLNPRGLSVDASGNTYFADSGNQVVRSLSTTALTTVAGSGAQGFAGDLGTASLAVLDTPRATAVSSNGIVTFADAGNQRVRSVGAAIVTTVAGVPPPLTEGLFLSGPVTGTFGTAGGRLTATFSSPVSSATGSLVLNVNGQNSATAPITANTASFDLSGLAGGIQTLAVSFAGDTNNAPAVSGVFLVSVAAAAQAINFTAPPSPVTYTPGATVQLTASASSGLPITFQVTGPATVNGSTLTYTGAGPVVVTAVQAGNANYAATNVSRTVTVLPSPLVAASVNPANVSLSAATTPVTITGSGFTATSVVRAGGVALASTVQGVNTIRATLPPVLATTPFSVTVYDPASQLESNALPITVTAPAANATLSAPSTGTSAQLPQPALNLTLQNAYPVPIQGVLTLTFAALGNSAVDDASIQFQNGSRSFAFTVPANTTTLPAVQFQTGTLAGTATFTLALTAAGVDVTPPASRVVTVVIPAEVPTANSVSFTQSGTTVTVTLVGFSNTRSVSQATFNFTPAPGTNLDTKSLSLPVTTIFNDWFSSAASSTLGSVFTYTQTFNLSDTDAKVQSVSVTLTNAVGNSAPKTTP